MNVNDEVVMRELTRISLEKAFQICAEKAKWAADECADDVSGRDALLSFSKAILSTNSKTWPAEGIG